MAFILVPMRYCKLNILPICNIHVCIKREIHYHPESRKKHTVGGKNSFENDEVLADILMQVCIS